MDNNIVINKDVAMHKLSGKFKSACKRLYRFGNGGILTKQEVHDTYYYLDNSVELYWNLHILSLEEYMKFQEVLIDIENEAVELAIDRSKNHALHYIGRQVRYLSKDVIYSNSIPAIYFNKRIAEIEGMIDLAYELDLLTEEELEFYYNDITGVMVDEFREYR